MPIKAGAERICALGASFIARDSAFFHEISNLYSIFCATIKS